MHLPLFHMCFCLSLSPSSGAPAPIGHARCSEQVVLWCSAVAWPQARCCACVVFRWMDASLQKQNGWYWEEGRKQGACPQPFKLWPLMLGGREYSAAAQGRMHATPLCPHLWAGGGRPPLIYTFAFDWRGGALAWPAGPLPAGSRLDQLAAACWSAGAMDGSKASWGEVQEGREPACMSLCSMHLLASLSRLPPCKLARFLQACGWRSACDCRVIRSEALKN
jgi:hypothetical protein